MPPSKINDCWWPVQFFSAFSVSMHHLAPFNLFFCIFFISSACQGGQTVLPKHNSCQSLQSYLSQPKDSAAEYLKVLILYLGWDSNPKKCKQRVMVSLKEINCKNALWEDRDLCYNYSHSKMVTSPRLFRF